MCHSLADVSKAQRLLGNVHTQNMGQTGGHAWVHRTKIMNEIGRFSIFES
jgi:hypothetical protein